MSDLSADAPEAEQALQLAFFKYANPLIQFARRFSLSKESAEDAVQNVFLAVWRSRLEVSVKDNLKSYLYTAVRHQALNHLRHSKTVADAEQQIRLNLPDPKEHVDRVEYEQLQQSIQRAVNDLPSECKRIFLLSRLDGMTYSQIATALDLSVKTVETQMGRALKHLRSAITLGITLFIILSIYPLFL